MVCFEIILFDSKTWEDHLNHLRYLLKTLEDKKLQLNMCKCEFSKHVLLYLGFMVGGDRIGVDPIKE